MTTRLAFFGLLLVGACKDTPRTQARDIEPPNPGASRVTHAPVLTQAEGPWIANLDAMPASASARLESTVLAIVENRTTDFVDSVSTGGFTIGSFALTKEQAQAELAGRTVSELTNVACASVDACAWSVTERSPKELQLEARANGALVGAVVFALEDDGSWGVIGAMSVHGG